jgi:hypothetical protein
MVKEHSLNHRSFLENKIGLFSTLMKLVMSDSEDCRHAAYRLCAALMSLHPSATIASFANPDFNSEESFLQSLEDGDNARGVTMSLFSGTISVYDAFLRMMKGLKVKQISREWKRRLVVLDSLATRLLDRVHNKDNEEERGLVDGLIARIESSRWGRSAALEASVTRVAQSQQKRASKPCPKGEDWS